MILELEKKFRHKNKTVSKINNVKIQVFICKPIFRISTIERYEKNSNPEEKTFDCDAIVFIADLCFVDLPVVEEFIRNKYGRGAEYKHYQFRV